MGVYGFDRFERFCILLGADVLLNYNLSPETLDIAFKLLFIHGFFVMVIWPVSFTLPMRCGLPTTPGLR